SSRPHTSEASRRRRGEWSTSAAIVNRSQRRRSTGRCTAWAMVPAPITAMFKVFGIGRLLGLGGSGGSSAGSRRAPCRLRHRAPDQRGAHARFYHTGPLPSRAVPLAPFTARSPAGPAPPPQASGGRRAVSAIAPRTRAGRTPVSTPPSRSRAGPFPSPPAPRGRRRCGRTGPAVGAVPRIGSPGLSWAAHQHVSGGSVARRFYFGARRISRPLVELLWNPRVTGLENIPREGGFVIASNHLANIDSFVLPVVLPRQIRFVAKDTLWTQTGLRGRILRWFFDAVEAVPVDREALSSGKGALQAGLTILREGDGFAIYPEGTR